MTETDAKTADRAYALQKEIAEIVREEIGMKPDLASLFASRIVTGLQRRRAGDELYVPAGIGSDQRATRDADIRANFNGRNLEIFCTRYGISRALVYKISRKK
jgi:Mor family transcriptional regulator